MILCCFNGEIQWYSAWHQKWSLPKLSTDFFLFPGFQGKGTGCLKSAWLKSTVDPPKYAEAVTSSLGTQRPYWSAPDRKATKLDMLVFFSQKAVFVWSQKIFCRRRNSLYKKAGIDFLKICGAQSGMRSGNSKAKSTKTKADVESWNDMKLTIKFKTTNWHKYSTQNPCRHLNKLLRYHTKLSSLRDRGWCSWCGTGIGPHRGGDGNFQIRRWFWVEPEPSTNCGKFFPWFQNSDFAKGPFWEGSPISKAILRCSHEVNWGHYLCRIVWCLGLKDCNANESSHDFVSNKKSFLLVSQVSPGFFCTDLWAPQRCKSFWTPYETPDLIYKDLPKGEIVI